MRGFPFPKSCHARAEQIIRPTGLLDPEISVRPVEGQIDDLVTEIRKTIDAGNVYEGFPLP